MARDSPSHGNFSPAGVRSRSCGLWVFSLRVPSVEVFGIEPGREVGWKEVFSDISEWHSTFLGGEMTAKAGIAKMRSGRKWFLFGAPMEVSLDKYPILCLRYRVLKPPPDKSGVWMKVRGGGLHKREVGFNAEPKAVVMIELNLHGPPHEVEWGFLRLASRPR